MACPIRLPGPYEPTRQPIPRHRAVGRLLVARGSWSGSSQQDSVRRNSATKSARSPTGGSGQPAPSFIPCRQTHQFNVVEQPGSTPPEPRQQQTPRHPGVLLTDNLNIHSPASLYEAVQPAEARRVSEWLEVHYTPRCGQWLKSRGDRVQRSRATTSEPAHSRPRDIARRNRSLARRSKSRRGRCQLALRRFPRDQSSSLSLRTAIHTLRVTRRQYPPIGNRDQRGPNNSRCCEPTGRLRKVFSSLSSVEAYGPCASLDPPLQRPVPTPGKGSRPQTYLCRRARPAQSHCSRSERWRPQHGSCRCGRKPRTPVRATRQPLSKRTRRSPSVAAWHLPRSKLTSPSR